MSHLGLSLKQTVSTRLEQKLVITPQLQQAIKLLQLNHVELQEMLEEEMLENPVLEASEEEGMEPTLDAEPPGEPEPQEAKEGAEGEAAAAEAEAALAEAEAAPEEPADPFGDIDWEAYFEDTEFRGSVMPSGGGDYDPDLPSMESRVTPHTSLAEHLQLQLNLVRMSQDAQNMSVLIIGHLDHRGWLVLDEKSKEDPLKGLAKQMAEEEAIVRPETIGEQTREEREHYWYVKGKEALRAIQNLEPAGVAARSLEECLLLQCNQLEELEDPDLIDRLIRDHLRQIERKQYNAIGKQIKISLKELVDSAEAISQLDPYPSRAFQSEPTAYISPDIHVKRSGDGYEVSLNDDGMPKLKINAYYKQLLKEKEGSKEFIQEKLRNATWLLRSIHQRQQTIYKVTESIVKKQRDFFDKGLQHLKPMILRDVAEDIEMHESTISRVTTNKYVHTPQGVFELKFFFTSSLQASDGGEDVSSLTVKEKIKQLVADEDPKSPLSDQAIVKILGSEGIKIARRTVAKYRGILNIPPSNRRKQPY